MKWRGNNGYLTAVVAIALFVVFGITASAQAGAAVAVGAGIAHVVEVGVGAALLANEFAMPDQGPMVRMAQQRAAYSAKQATLVADSHAVAKHGAEAQTAYAQTARVNGQNVVKYNCGDGRVRTVNWLTGDVRVEQDGQVVTAFRYEDREYLKRALLRDGCVDTVPTRAVGHDDVTSIPSWPRGVVPLETGQLVPVKARTPTAYELANARARMNQP